MGVEMAHYHHVLLVFMYLVNGNVRQHCGPDFGDWMLDIEDRIQKQNQMIWNDGVLPQRTNGSEFKPFTLLLLESVLFPLMTTM